MNRTAHIFLRYSGILVFLVVGLFSALHANKADVLHQPDIPAANIQAPEEMQKDYLDKTQIDNLEATLKNAWPKAVPANATIFQAQKTQQSQDRIRALYSQARSAARNGDIEGAENAYVDILSRNIPDDNRRELLIEMADMYRNAKYPVKEIAVYETFVDIYPKDPRTPRIYLELGCLYRDVGSDDMALARFYNVLNLALNYDESNLEEFKDLSTRAQIEIAETYFRNGQYRQASKFLDRLKLVKLPAKQAAQIYFKDASAHYFQQNYLAASVDFKEFINRFPSSDMLAEAYFDLADCYRKLGQHKESLQTVMDLLQLKAVSDEDDPRSMLMWKKRTGNQLANELYEQGDFLGALSIYQAMAPLSKEPQWQWPVLYQIGLCFERLMMYPKAREAYRLIVESQDAKTLMANQNSKDANSNQQADAIVSIDPLELLLSSAQWRMASLDRTMATDIQLQELSAKENKPPSQPKKSPAVVPNSPVAQSDAGAPQSAPSAIVQKQTSSGA